METAQAKHTAIGKLGMAVDHLDVVHGTDSSAEAAALTLFVSTEPGSNPILSQPIGRRPQAI
jgi:hypothetical protein